MTSQYPGAIDNFSESSPTYMSDPDATGRVHSSRHDDVESAIEQVQETLGVNPQGPNATVAARIAGISSAGADTVLDAPTVLIKSGGVLRFGASSNGNNYNDAGTHYFRTLTEAIHTAVSPSAFTYAGRNVPTHYWDESVGRRLFIWDTTNARWQMVYGDTGWRDVSALLDANGLSSGSISMRRVNNDVWLRFGYAVKGSAANVWSNVTAGFQAYAGTIQAVGRAGSNDLGTMYAGGAVWTISGAAGQNFLCHLSYRTNDPWPAALPGTAEGTIPTADTLLPADDDTPTDIDPEIPTGLSPDDDTSDWTVTYPEGPTP